MEEGAGVRAYFVNRGRIAMACALVHVIDLDRFLAITERVASAEGVLAGFPLDSVANAGDWADIARALLAVRALPAASHIDEGVKAMVEHVVSALLREGENLW